MGEWTIYLGLVAGLAPSTVRAYRRMVAPLLELAGIDEVGAAELEALLRRLALEGKSASMHLARSAARSLGDYLVHRGLRPANPFHGVRAPRRYAREAPTLTAGEVRKLIYGPRPGYLPEDLLATRNRVMLGVMYMAGLRVSEPGRLRVATLDRTVDGGYSVLVEHGKWAREDVRFGIFDPIVGLYLTAWVEAFRPRFLDGAESPWLFPSSRRKSGELGRLANATVSRIFHASVKAAGIERRGRAVTPHILRHSLATHLHAAGNAPRWIQKWMRHRSLETTQRYIHVRSASAREVFRGRRGPLGPSG